MVLNTLIVSHAQFLKPDIWPVVMWGNPKEYQLGVLAKTVELALEEDANLYLCCGIPNQGGREFSPDSRVFLDAHYHELPAFQGLRRTTRSRKYQELCRRIVVFNETAQTTREEVRGVAQYLASAQMGIQRVIALSPPKHIMRVQQDYLLAKARGEFGGVEILTMASDVNFPKATAADVVILEKAHRHDAQPAMANLHKIGKAVIALLRQGDMGKLASFTSEFWGVAQRFGIRED